MIRWQDIEGWFSEGDADFVTNICASIKNGIVVEIGVFAGRSTAVMAPICMANGTEYNAIDSFWGGNNSDDDSTVAHRTGEGRVRRDFERNMREASVWDHISLHECYSAEVAKEFADETLDFCFIDGDHTPEGVHKDLIAWWPKVKQGGVLGGHDYPTRACKAVNPFAAKMGLSIQHGCKQKPRLHSCWAIRKTAS